MLITVEQAVEQCNLFAPHSLIEGYITAAQAIAESYLNRRVYKDQEQLDAARAIAVTKAADSFNAYQVAIDQAASLTNPAAKATALDVAEVQYRDAVVEWNRVIHGMVANPAIFAAILIIVSDLNENRESSINGSQAEVPQSAQNILRRFRRIMMP